MLPAEPEALLAARLVERAAGADRALVMLARSEARAARLLRAAHALAPRALAVQGLPGWDCLPYDRVSPSASVMAARLAWAAGAATAPGLHILSVAAATQRLPREAARLEVAAGQEIAPETLLARLVALGYREDELVDEPGEAALRGATLDVFAAGGTAWRIRFEAGRIEAIAAYDPLSQRSGGALPDRLAVDPASEIVLPEDHPLAQARPVGVEHWLPAFAPDLVAPLDLLPDAAILLDDGAAEALERRFADVAEAFRLRIASARQRPDLPPLPPPEALYLDAAAWRAALGGRETVQAEGAGGALPRFAAEADPERAVAAFVRSARARGARLVVAGGIGHGARRFAARLAGAVPREADGWPEVLRAPDSAALLLRGDPGEGFADEAAALIPFAAIRPGAVPAEEVRVEGLAPAALQPGDAVIHATHGLGELRGVEAVQTGEARTDCLRLDYAEGDSRLVPFEEMPLLWRYGATAESVALDRLDGAAWRRRRAEAEAAARADAARLLELLRARDAERAAPVRPPAEPMRRVAAGFGFEPTPDQAGAIEATLADLACERPMDRLVCGDVGFGKTEVAIRAAAAAALAGRQVAVIAPTTVLARQHEAVFRRRLEPLGLCVGALSRLTPAAEAKAVRAGIASGEVAVAIGTTALAAKAVRFRDLALIVVDEEQRFGAKEKARLAALGGAPAHRLTMTATPIPQTLAGALIGLRDLSVIATPPVRRQPVRTLRGTAEDGLVAQALRREARRGGQSFVVCPRIEDIEPWRARIAALLPDLSLVVAHGGLPAAEMDAAMVRFADGDGDVLLATGIVETGLDVPRANTMLVLGADRFGLAQLHQLRGRVGRGRQRGIAWLLTEPGTKLAPATDRRLKALVAMDRLGAGFAISARDLDLRGAGELLGEKQAGHLRLVGIELHGHLLRRALAEARGGALPEEWVPSLALGLDAFIPAEHVPEDALRVEIHARLGAALRDGDATALDTLEEEAEDRFGPPPAPLANLFAQARLALRCRALGIARLEAGPQAAAARFRGAAPAVAPPLVVKDGRVLLRRPLPDAAARLAAVEELLTAIERAGRLAA